MTRLHAACTTQEVVGCAVTPRIRMRRSVCSMSANTYSRPGQGDGFEEVAREERVRLGAQEVRPGTGRPLGCRRDPGVLEDLPDRGRRHIHAEDEQFTVQAPVAPGRVL